MKKYLLMFGLFLLFATEAKALSCGPGTYLYVSDCGSGSEQCNLCPYGCSTCSGVSGTTTCQYWDQEQGKEIKTTATTTYSTCDSCDSGFELTRHANGFYSCERKSITCPSNCSSCSSSSTCTACKSGYTLKNGQCVKPCPANCSKCDSSGFCTQCNGGYKLKNGACEAGSVISCPDDMRLSADGCCCIPN